MHLRTLTALAICVMAAGCSTPRLYYETTVFQHPPLNNTKGQRAGLLKTVRSALGDRSLEVPGKGGGWRQVHPGPAGALDKVNPALLYAVVAVADDDFLGAEADIIIHGPGKRRTPVTVKVGLDGSVYASAGGATPTLRRWNKRGQGKVAGIVAATLSLLSPNERNVIEAVEWHRGGRAPGAKGGHYFQRGCRAQIHIYNRAFAGDGLQFTGDPSRPRQAAMRSLLHEIGHAIHHRQSRRAWCKHERFKAKGDVSAANKWGKRAQALDETEGPVLAAYRRALAGQEAPTVYGEESDAESFAESFSIWKADPAALKRTLPHIAKWFAGDGHLKHAD